MQSWLSSPSCKLEPWRLSWRRYAAPFLPTPGLEALREALHRDDPDVIAGANVWPPADARPDEAIEMACPVCFALWKAGQAKTTRELQERFSGLVAEANAAYGGEHALSPLLTWVDASPREEMRQQLLGEVGLELDRRRAAVA